MLARALDAAGKALLLGSIIGLGLVVYWSSPSIFAAGCAAVFDPRIAY